MAYHYQGQIETDRLIKDQQLLAETAIVQLKKLELDYILARVGLQGTLWGAWASLLVVLLLVFSPVVTKRDLLTGWQIVVMVSTMVVAIVFYGTFIFQRALSVSAKRDESGRLNIAIEALLDTQRRLEQEGMSTRMPGAPHAVAKRQQSAEPTADKFSPR